MKDDVFTLDGRAVRAIGNRIVVQKILPATRTPGGLHIPETARDRPREGYVLAIGPEVKERDAFTLGQRVHFNPYAGSTQMPHEGTDVIASVPEADVFFVYQDA
jgi:chaperonin GroES